MDAESLRGMFGLATRALAANLEGFTEEDALAQPPGGGNCVNWVVGHIIVHRNHMLRALGQEPAWGADADARYDRGSPPVTSVEDALPLATLTEALDRSREAVLAALEAATEEQLAAVSASAGGRAAAPAGRVVAMLMVHEGYHAGQVATLRRISGRAGAIR